MDHYNPELSSPTCILNELYLVQFIIIMTIFNVGEKLQEIVKLQLQFYNSPSSTFVDPVGVAKHLVEDRCSKLVYQNTDQ